MQKLWDHQVRAIELARTTNCLGLFYEVGTGKTRCTIEIIRERMNNAQRYLSTLILAPPITLIQWKDQFLKWSKLEESRIIILSGNGKKRLQLFKDAQKRYGSEFVAITNYESLLMSDLYSAIKDWEPEIIVADEVHKIKSESSKRTKLVLGLSTKSKYRYGLTGTAVLNNGMDLFTQIKFLDGGKALGHNFYAFRARYFYNKNSGWNSQKSFPIWVAKPGSEKDLGRLIAPITIQAKKSECLDLPPLVEQEVNVDLSPEQARHYILMMKEFLTFLTSGETVSAELAITKSIRLRQILAGFLQDTEGKVHIIKDNPRIDALKEIIEGLPESAKFLIWTNFKPTYGIIGDLLTSLKIEHRFITGEQTQAQKNEAVREFEQGSSVRAIVANPQSAGVGVSLTQASYAIWYQNDFNLESKLQSQGRNFRGGSTIHDKVTWIDIVASGTIDAEILRALKNKENIAEALLRAAKQV